MYTDRDTPGHRPRHDRDVSHGRNTTGTHDRDTADRGTTGTWIMKRPARPLESPQLSLPSERWGASKTDKPSPAVGKKRAVFSEFRIQGSGQPSRAASRTIQNTVTLNAGMLGHYYNQTSLSIPNHFPHPTGGSKGRSKNPMHPKALNFPELKLPKL